jgi:hypothetical protein
MVAVTSKILGGLFLMLFGLIGAGYGLFVYSNQTKNIQLCNSLPGAFNQLNTNACNKIPDFLTMGISIEAIGTLMILIGIVLLVSGLKQKGIK